ncbi:MAG: hypothetical protein GXP40_03320 [Chloroflexi bacterium]|nr:hypothetical protein [Chloroflexota bacterium]
MNPDLTTLGILLAVLVIGYLIGLLQSSSSAPSPDDDTPEGTPEADQGEPGEVNVLRLWLDPEQKTGLELDGVRVDTATLTGAQRRRLLALINKMRPWLEKPPAPSAPVLATQPPVEPAKKDKAEKIVPDKPATSMVEQIDSILQAKLSGHPLSSRGIRLRESSTGGVLVYVGLTRYEGVGEIMEPAIQAIIREAIAEWEESVTPGL